MNRRVVQVIAVVLVAACGADNTDGLTFTVHGVPALFDARLDDGPWQMHAPKAVVDGNAVYNVPTFRSMIDAVFVCESADTSFDAHEIRTTDAEDVGAYCDVSVDRDQLAVTLHGASPRAYVDVDDAETFIDQADGEVVLQARKPVTDVIVHDASHFVVQRGIDTADGPSEVAIDLTMTPPPRFGRYVWDPLDADETSVFAFSDYATDEAYARFPFGTAGSYMVPDASLVAPTDRWSAQLIATSPTSEREVDFLSPDPSASPVMHWMPRITGTIDATTTEARIDPFAFDYDTISVICSATGGTESVSMSRAYRDGRVDVLAFDEDVPGWRWTLGSDHRACSAGMRRLDANTYVATSFY